MHTKAHSKWQNSDFDLEGLDEPVTEWLVKRAAIATGIEYTGNTYAAGVAVIEGIAPSLGSKALTDAYFGGDIGGLNRVANSIFRNGYWDFGTTDMINKNYNEAKRQFMRGMESE